MDLVTMTPTELLNSVNRVHAVYVSVDLGGWAVWMRTTKQEARNMVASAARNDTAVPAYEDSETLYIG